MFGRQKKPKALVLADVYRFGYRSQQLVEVEIVHEGENLTKVKWPARRDFTVTSDWVNNHRIMERFSA